MEKNHKNTDCYFFYYSTCTKGDGCAYRHEPSALGCETVCSYWQQGSCLNQHCNFRHMEIKKNRSVIPCYWEKFPAGCKKPHCPFLHRLSRTGMPNPIEPVKTATTPVKPVNQEWTNRPDGKFDGNSTESDPGRGSSEAGSFIGSPVVDPLIVNFEEASSLQTSLNLPPPPQTQQAGPGGPAPAPVQAPASSLLSGSGHRHSLGLPPRASLASSQSSPCHHRPSPLSFGPPSGPQPPPPPPHHPPPPPHLLHPAAHHHHHHHHHHRAGPALSPLQPPPPTQPSHQQPSSPLLQRPGPQPYQQQPSPQAQAAAATRFPYPFLATPFASYRRF